MDQRGFTLLEVLIVVVIIGIAAALVGPSIEAGFRAREVRSATRAIAGTLKAVHGNAIRSGKIQTVYVDPGRNLLAFADSAQAVELGDVAGILELRGGDYQPGGTVQVKFFPNGSTSGLTLAVGDRLAPRDGTYVIWLDPLIGVVTVRDATR